MKGPSEQPLLVKLCGLQTPEEVGAAVSAGADLVGFVFAPSRRRLELDQGARLARLLPDGVRSVAVLHHPTRAHLDEVLRVVQPDLIQVEGAPALPPGVGQIRVLHDGPSFDLALAGLESGPEPELVLLDPRDGGGQGLGVDPSRLARLARRHRLLLAGGLHPDNVARAVGRLSPAGVDVSSGIESSPGRKCPSLMTAFVTHARAARRRAA